MRQDLKHKTKIYFNLYFTLNFKKWLNAIQEAWHALNCNYKLYYTKENVLEKSELNGYNIRKGLFSIEVFQFYIQK
jgi:hypothetical protein